VNDFRYTSYAQEIIFGAGSLAKLGDATAVYGWKRLMLCTSSSLRKNGTAARIERILGEQLAAVFDSVSPHVQMEQVKDALRLADERRVDAVIGLGGGSPIGMAKAVSMNLEAKRAGIEMVQARYPTDQPAIPGIMIPTTYAGSEMTPMYGITQPMADGSTRKVTILTRCWVPVTFTSRCCAATRTAATWKRARRCSSGRISAASVLRP
jgi:alcohol dehydrogenase class IV